MLTYLRIRNFGIFHDIDLELGPGLTVFTGETGAGKSMIVDAVMACLGYRTSSDVIRSGEERAVPDLLISLASLQASCTLIGQMSLEMKQKLQFRETYFRKVLYAD